MESMEKVNKRVINKDRIIKILIFLIITSIFYFAPYAHDDWAWGTQIGIERLHSYFENYNGRWAGNILVLVLTRCRLFKALFSSLTMMMIVGIINRIINKSNSKIIYLVTSLIMLMPYTIIAQTLSWTSGFSNYVISFALVLLFIYLNIDIINNEEKIKSNKILIVPLLLLGFITSLFLENLTIYNLLLVVFLIIYQLIKNKKVKIENVFYFIGSLAGTILMFSNGAYHNIANASDQYRTIEQGNFIIRAIKTYFSTIYKFLIQDNFIINIFIGILILLITINFLKNNKDIKRTKRFTLGINSVIIVGYITYIVFLTISGNSNVFITEKYQTLIEGIIAILFFLAILISSVIAIDNKKIKQRIAFDLISIVVLTGPLLIVTPIGPRNFFMSYVLFTMVGCELFNYIDKKENFYIKNILITITFILLFCHFAIFSYIYKIEYERTNYINDNQKTDILYLPKLPYEKYMQHGNPYGEVFVERFKIFYGIKESQQVRFVDYEEFKE